MYHPFSLFNITSVKYHLTCSSRRGDDWACTSHRPHRLTSITDCWSGTTAQQLVSVGMPGKGSGVSRWGLVAISFISFFFFKLAAADHRLSYHTRHPSRAVALLLLLLLLCCVLPCLCVALRCLAILCDRVHALFAHNRLTNLVNPELLGRLRLAYRAAVPAGPMVKRGEGGNASAEEE